MNDIIKSPLFVNLSFIKHGFLTKVSPTVPLEAGISCKVKQVHGNTVLYIKGTKTFDKHTEADILVTDKPLIALNISTADCVPLLFCDIEKKVIAASHAGWRGTAKNVAQKTVEALQKRGCQPENIMVAIGPSIHACCYEVDKPVYDSFLSKDFFKHNPEHKDHWMFDLPGMNRYQLVQAGVLAKNIWISEHCTNCRADLFFSYRREKKGAGRQFSFISLLS